MLTQLAALKTLFTGNATLTAAYPGGYYFAEAPETTTTFPYAICVVVANPAEQRYGALHHESLTLSIVSYATGVTAALNALTAAEAMYPVVEAATLGSYDVRRLTGPTLAEAGFEAQGRMVWMAAVDFVLNHT